LVGFLIRRPPFGEDCGDMVGEGFAGFCRLTFEATVQIWVDINWLRLGVGFAHAAHKKPFCGGGQQKNKNIFI
jgi:hypothetical protein